MMDSVARSSSDLTNTIRSDQEILQRHGHYETRIKQHSMRGQEEKRETLKISLAESGPMIGRVSQEILRPN